MLLAAVSRQDAALPGKQTAGKRVTMQLTQIKGPSPLGRDHVQVRMLQLGPGKQSLAVVALLFLLLRPLCDVWAAGHGDAQSGPAAQPSAWQDDHGVAPHDGGSCCATIEDGTLAKPGESGAMPVGTRDQAAIAAAAWIPAAYGGVSMPTTRKPPGVPPPALSYHARSARIQR